MSQLAYGCVGGWRTASRRSLAKPNGALLWDLAICRETGDRHGEGAALNNLGMALRQVRRFEEAIGAHQDAAAIFREAGDQHYEAIALRNLEDDRAAQQ